MVEADIVFTFNRAVNGVTVGKYDGMGVFSMFKEIEDAFFLQDATDKAEIALSVLGAVAFFLIL